MGREENRTQQREQEQEEQLQQQEERSGSSSRLGKEAKIGVTAILLLLIVFGVVLVVRLTRSSADGQPIASAATQQADNDRPGIMLSGAARMYEDRFGVAPGWQCHPCARPPAPGT